MSSLSSFGGITNDAFLDDEDESVDINITYAKWINKHDLSDSKVLLDLMNKNKEVVRELNESFNQCQSLEESDDSSINNFDFDIFQRPTRNVRRADIIASISGKYKEGSLGKMCNDKNCPYNQWLYHGADFPEHRLLKKWERELKNFHETKEESTTSELKLNPNLLTKFFNRSTPVNSTSSSSQGIPSLSYFQFNDIDSYLNQNPLGTPTFNTLPPYSWKAYNSPSTVSSSYPIVTLPRSQRKKKNINLSLNLFKGDDLSTAETLSKGRPSRPPSATSSSCSCTNTSCSSCSSSYEMSDFNPFTMPEVPILQKTIEKQSRRNYSLVPRCDMTCYIISSFILLSLAALASIFIYFYLFAPVN